MGAARAADDDLNSSVYLVFDPETGEFVTVEDQDGTKRKHESLGISDMGSAPASDDVQADGETSSPVGITIAIVLLGVAIFLERGKKRGLS